MKEEKTYTKKEVMKLLEEQKKLCAEQITGLMTEYTARKKVKEAPLAIKK